MGFKSRFKSRDWPKALCQECREPQPLRIPGGKYGTPRGTVFAHSRIDSARPGGLIRVRCPGSEQFAVGHHPDGFTPATFYYVKGSDGSMALYYKAGTDKAMHASASHAELSADEIDPRLYLQMKVSDKFAAIKGLPVDGRTPGQIFDDSLRSRFPGF